MNKRTYVRLALLCVLIAILAGVASAVGVFARGSGSTLTAKSIRGETYEYVTDGVYAYNAQRVVAEGVGWDGLTLFVAVPALLLAVPGVSRGSLRARLLAAGVLGYLVYQYLMYSVFWALGPLFPVFVVLYPLAAAAIVWIVATIDVRALPGHFTEKLPRKGMAAFSLVMALQLVLMWTSRIATGLSGDVAGAGLLGQPTLSVQALDLGIIVPLAVVTAVTALKRAPVSYLLIPVFAVKGVTMSGAICAMLLSAWIVEGKLETVPFALFGVATAVAGVLAFKTLASVREDAVDAATRSALQASSAAAV